MKPIWQQLAKRNESLGGKGVEICTPLKRVNGAIAKAAGASARHVSKVETILGNADAPDGSDKEDVLISDLLLAASTFIIPLMACPTNKGSSPV